MAPLSAERGWENPKKKIIKILDKFLVIKGDIFIYIYLSMGLVSMDLAFMGLTSMVGHRTIDA